MILVFYFSKFLFLIPQEQSLLRVVVPQLTTSLHDTGMWPVCTDTLKTPHCYTEWGGVMVVKGERGITGVY